MSMTQIKYNPIFLTLLERTIDLRPVPQFHGLRIEQTMDRLESQGML